MISVYNVGEELEDDNVKLSEIVTRKEAIIASRTLHNFCMYIEKTTPRVFDAIKKIRIIRPGSIQSKIQEETIHEYEKFLTNK